MVEWLLGTSSARNSTLPGISGHLELNVCSYFKKLIEITIMKVLVHYKSGVHQVFIVPMETNVAEFRRMAEEIGGPLRKIEFPSTPSTVSRANPNLGYGI